MSNRLAFDIGLHLDCTSNGMPDQEVQIRRMVMRACVIFDRYWALFLGRPTSIKSQDIGMDLLSDKLSMLQSDLAPPRGRDIVIEVYEQLIELMELAGRIVEMRDQHAMKKKKTTQNNNNMFALNEAEDNAYLHVINLDRQLQNWYRRLPEHLAWKPANIKTAPYSFFLLHQQYHVSMILLHRPWTKYDTEGTGSNPSSSHPSPEGGHMNPEAAAGVHATGIGGGSDHALGIGDPNSMIHDSRASLSRSICTQQAIRVARIFWQHRQHFDGRKIFVTGIQHAGTAVLALVAALGVQCNDSDRRTYLGYLEILSDALADMSHTYHPAGRMDDLLKAVLIQIRLGLGESPRSFHGFTLSGEGSGPSVIVPLRREAADVDSGYPSKRRRPGNSRRASELPRVPPPFFSARQAMQRPSLFSGDDGTHQRPGSDVDSMLFSLGLSTSAGGADTMGMGNYMQGSAIDMDADDLNLVASSEVWGMGSMHSDHSQQHHQHHQQSRPFDTPVGNEYAPGPAGLSASSVLGQNPTGGMYPPPSKPDTAGDGDITVLDPAMVAEMSPANLAEMVQSVEDGMEDGEKRNHELDFFSFS